MSRTVLVVEDSATMRISLQSSLEMAGYKVQLAIDGLDGINKLKDGFKPDLIITDVNMPNMGGIEFVKQAREVPGLKFSPILVLTTESEVGKREEARKQGATGWLVKPVAGPELLKVINQVLPRSK